MQNANFNVAFTELLEFVKHFRIYLKNQNIKEITIHYLNEIGVKIDILKKCKITETSLTLTAFEQQLLGIYKIYDTCVGEYAKLYLSKEVIAKYARPQINKLFSILKISKPKSIFLKVPAQILAKFLKGITYFENESNLREWPVYHRDESCGTKLENVYTKFGTEDKKHLLEKCYIERLIFDSIYQHILHKQDKLELKKVEQLWETFFPDKSIEVNIGYDDFGNPNILSIYTTMKNKTISIQELYITENDIVKCEKVTYRNRKNGSPFLIEKLTKTQTFASEKPWKQYLRHSV